MAKGIDIAIAADTRSAMSAINRGLVEPLEDVSETLEHLADDSKDATDALERGMRDAQRRTDDAKDEIRDLRDSLNRAGRAGKDAGGDVDDGMSRIRHAASETSDELRQNLGETFSSFRGDLEDLPQIAQDTLGGLAGSGALGGIPGLAVTAAGAAGLGLIIGALDVIGEDSKRMEERANSLAQAYIDAGTTVLDTVTLASRVSEVLTTPEQRAEAQKLVDVLGVDLPEAARILAGDTNALAAAQEVLAGKNAELNETRDEGRLLAEEEAAALADQQKALDDAGRALGTYAENNATAAQTAREYSDALKSMISEAGESSVKIDELGNQLIQLPDNTEVMIDAKTGQATTDITKFKGDADGVIDQLNGRDIVLDVQAAVLEAQNTVNRFVTQNEGRTIKIGAKIVTQGEGWDR